jgi:hypothetical protein
MKKKIMQQWVNALRSGKFKQTKNKLHSPALNSYCCLGVLCEIAAKKGICKKQGKYFDFCDQTLPTKVLEWSGIKSHEGAYNYNNLSLIELNDLAKQNFGQIANIIERNYKLL